MTLDGLIERLQEIRKYASKDLPIRAGDSFDSDKNDKVITRVCLDTRNGIDKHVSIVVERPLYSHLKIINYDNRRLRKF